jgi:hypothetical protein
MKRSTKERKNEPIKLSDSLIGNIEILIAQCHLTNYQADNTDSHVISFAKSIRQQAYTPEDVMSVWKLLLNAYVSNKIKRRGVLSRALLLFRPFYYFVYLLVKEEKIIYVGKTINLQERMKDHAANKDFDDIQIYICCDKNEQDILENTCIFKYQPPLNKAVRLSEVDMDMEVPVFTSAKDFCFPLLTGCTSRVKPFFLVDSNYYFIQNLGFVHKSNITAEVQISLLTADPNYKKPAKSYPEGYTYISGVGLIKNYN